MIRPALALRLWGACVAALPRGRLRRSGFSWWSWRARRSRRRIQTRQRWPDVASWDLLYPSFIVVDFNNLIFIVSGSMVWIAARCSLGLGTLHGMRRGFGILGDGPLQSPRCVQRRGWAFGFFDVSCGGNRPRRRGCRHYWMATEGPLQAIVLHVSWGSLSR